MDAKEKAQLIKTLRTLRLDDVKTRLHGRLEMHRLQARLLKNQEKQHAPIIKKAAKLFGSDKDMLDREHQKADQLIRKQLASQKKKIAANGKEVNRSQKRKLNFAKRTAKTMQTSSAALIHSGGIFGANTCLWRADSDERVLVTGTPNEESFAYRYGVSNGENLIRFRLMLDSEDAYGLQFSWRNYQLNFYYEQEESGVIGISSYFDPNGVATVRASPSGGCLYNPPSGATGRVRAYIAATGTDFAGNPTTWSPMKVDLFGFGVSNGGVNQQPIYESDTVEYTTPLPILGGAPIIISVGIEAFIDLNGVGHSELDFFNSPFRVNFPYVWVTRY